MNTHILHHSPRQVQAMGWKALTAVGLGAAAVSCAEPQPPRESGWKEVAQAPDSLPSTPPEQDEYLTDSVGGPFFLDAWKMDGSMPATMQGVCDQGQETQSLGLTHAQVVLSSDGLDVRVERVRFKTEDGQRELEITSQEGALGWVLASSPHRFEAIATIPVLIRGQWACPDEVAEVISTSKPVSMLLHFEATDESDGIGRVTARASLALPCPACSGHLVGLQAQFRVQGTFAGVELVH